MRGLLLAIVALLAFAAPAAAQTGEPVDTIVVGPGETTHGETVTGSATLAANTEYLLVVSGQMTREFVDDTEAEHDAFYCISNPCPSAGTEKGEVLYADTRTSGTVADLLSKLVQPDRVRPALDADGTYEVTIKVAFGGKLRVSTILQCPSPNITCSGPGYTLKIYTKPPPPPPPPPPPDDPGTTPPPGEQPPPGTTPPPGQQPRQPVFKITKITGEVAYRLDAGEWQALAEGQEVPVGAELFTGVESGLIVDFGDGETFELNELTQLLLETIAQRENRKDVRVRLVVGALNAQVKKEKVVDTNFEVQTPTATASVRGTVFSVFYDPGSKATLVSVVEGSVAVTPNKAGAAPRLVGAGKEIEVTPASVSKIVARGKAGARGGLNRAAAMARVLDRLGRAPGRCRLGVPRSAAGTQVATARRGWLVSVRITGRAAGTSSWRVRGKKVKARNRVAKRVAKGCR